MWIEPRPEALSISDFQILPNWQGRGIATGVLQGIITEVNGSRLAVGLAVLPLNVRVRGPYEAWVPGEQSRGALSS